jgi:2-keto-3-deoxy-L-fuconate dehydrogenase
MMTNRVAGKRALVTAAAAGIGRASVLALAKEGAHVLAIDIDEAGLREIGRTPHIDIARLDVTDNDAILSLAAAHQPFDILVNAAGRVDNGTIMDCSEEIWAGAFALNVTSMHRMIKALLPGMIARGGGSIINISSVASSIKGVPNRYVYGATKAAIIGLTKAIAVDFVRQKIRCNAVCPGTIETPSLKARIASADDPIEAQRAFIARQPMGRFGTPAEVANLILYLASDESEFTSGAVHIIDGAWSA